MKSILLLGLAEMTFGLVTASFSLPEGQAVKMIFFARCDGIFTGNVKLTKPIIMS